MARNVYTFEASDLRVLGALILNLNSLPGNASPYITVVNHDKGYTLVAITR